MITKWLLLIGILFLLIIGCTGRNSSSVGDPQQRMFQSIQGTWMQRTADGAQYIGFEADNSYWEIDSIDSLALPSVGYYQTRSDSVFVTITRPLPGDEFVLFNITRTGDSLIVSRQTPSTGMIRTVYTRRRPDGVAFSIDARDDGSGTLLVGYAGKAFYDSVSPQDFLTYNCHVRWTSSNPNIIRIDSISGMCEALRSGTVSIVAGLYADAGLILCADTIQIIATCRSAIAPTVDTAVVGDRIRFSALDTNFCREHGYRQVWRSADTTILKSDTNGNVTALHLGKASVVVDVRDAVNGEVGRDSAMVYVVWEAVPRDSTFPSGTWAPLSYDPVDSIIYAAMGGGAIGIYRSKNEGRTWENIAPAELRNRSGRCSHVEICPTENRRIALLWSGNYAGDLYLSEDGGSNWATKPAVVSGYPVSFAFSANNPNVGYGVSCYSSRITLNWGVYRIDLANNRTDSISSFTIAGGEAPVIFIDPSNPANLYASGGVSYGSIDTGKTWNLLVFPGHGSSFTICNVDALGRVYALDYNWDGQTKQRLIKSNDQGSTWQIIIQPSDSIGPDLYREVRTDESDTRFHYLLSGSNTAFYYSKDDALSWHGVHIANWNLPYSNYVSAVVTRRSPLRVLIVGGETTWWYVEPQ